LNAGMDYFGRIEIFKRIRARSEIGATHGGGNSDLERVWGMNRSRVSAPATTEAELEGDQAVAEMDSPEPEWVEEAEAEAQEPEAEESEPEDLELEVAEPEPEVAEPGLEVTEPEPEEPELEVAEPPGAGEGGTNHTVSLRSATFEELRGLGMSVTQARRVLHYRDERGLESVAGLAEVPGIPREFRAELEKKLTD
jgi:DNA uptake protein ComE-like DNA-binding protein